MFGSNQKNIITQEQLEDLLRPLTERIKTLEIDAQKLAKRVTVLEQKIKDCGVNTENVDVEAGFSTVGSHSSDSSVGLTAHDAPSVPLAADLAAEAMPTSIAQTLYMPAPTPEGLFLESMRSEAVGKSIYQLRTEDGINGQFIMLSTPDAIATATISISQFVKPVCRIEGNIHQLPRQIETLEEGIALREGNIWKVVRKARVVFLP